MELVKILKGILRKIKGTGDLIIEFLRNHMQNNNKESEVQELNNNSVELSFNLKNEVINLIFYVIGLIFLIFAAKNTNDWFAIAGAGMTFGFAIQTINTIGRILFKKYY